jgi:hypothetical protein
VNRPAHPNKLRAALLAFAAALATTLVTTGSAGADEAGETPDFTGYWMPNVGRSVTWPFSDPPYTDRGRALWDAYAAEFDTDVDDPSRLCVPEAMPRTMVQPPFPVEIIQREQDITLFFEAWSQYRKIFLAGHDHPEPVLRSRMGHSVGRWEGDTLIVETTYLRARDMGKIMMSEDARIEERIRLETDATGARRLVNDITFIDEAIYTQPIRTRGVWDDSPDTPVLEYICSEEIWERYIDTLRETGERIF